MNKTSIEWTSFTWNPVSGCFHECRHQFCYNTKKATSPLNRFGAKYMDESGALVYDRQWRFRETDSLHEAKPGEIFPYGYDPTFYPHRLKEPCARKKPSRIFTVDTGDLFGSWIPDEWIAQVFEIINKCPQHVFQLLTKNPYRLEGMKLPPNAWIGTSVATWEDRHRADALKRVKARIRYLSVEPLLGPFPYDFKGLQWVIMGVMTGKNPTLPTKRDAGDVVVNAREAGCRVFVKSNARKIVNGRHFLRQLP
jgi:protein gp37